MTISHPTTRYGKRSEMLFLVSYGELARVGGSEGILVENTPNDGTEVIGHMCVSGGLRLHMTSGL